MHQADARDPTVETELSAAVERAEQLEHALSSARVIGMAMGILMERHLVTADEAFDHLREASQRDNMKLRQVAEHLVLTGALPAGPPQRGRLRPPPP